MDELMNIGIYSLLLLSLWKLTINVNSLHLIIGLFVCLMRYMLFSWIPFKLFVVFVVDFVDCSFGDFWPQDSTNFCNSSPVILGIVLSTWTSSPSSAFGQNRHVFSRLIHNTCSWVEFSNYRPECKIGILSSFCY